MDDPVGGDVSATAADDHFAALDDRRNRTSPAASGTRESPPAVKGIGIRRWWKRRDVSDRRLILLRIGQESQLGLVGPVGRGAEQ